MALPGDPAMVSLGGLKLLEVEAVDESEAELDDCEFARIIPNIPPFMVMVRALLPV